MSLQAVELTTPQAVRDHAVVVARKIQAGRVTQQPAINLHQLMLELTTIKTERDQYLAMVAQLQAENVGLATRLERFTKRLSNLQHDAIVAIEAEQVVAPIDCSPIRRPKISLDQIIRAVAKYYNKTINDLLSHRRTVELTLPRHVACYLCKELTLRSLPEIGRRIGGRDHTTVLHGHRKIEKLIPLMPSVERAVKEISEQLVGGV